MELQQPLALPNRRPSRPWPSWPSSHETAPPSPGRLRMPLGAALESLARGASMGPRGIIFEKPAGPSAANFLIQKLTVLGLAPSALEVVALKDSPSAAISRIWPRLAKICRRLLEMAILKCTRLVEPY